MAWVKTKPANTEKLKDTPALIRANWDAIELGTDSALQVTNAKVAAAAGIVDTKLATISTAGKVSGAALTSLASVPSGAGALPAVNVPNIDGSKLVGLASIPSGSGLIPDANMPTTVVKTTGTQTIAGAKTFSTIPILPASDPTTANQAARKSYVDAHQGKFESALLHVRDEKTAGTDGGTFTLGAWRTRTLNTTKTNEISGASLASNQITLPAGTYWIDALAAGHNVSLHKAKLRNITDSSDAVIGTSELAQPASGGDNQSFSVVRGRFTIAGTKVFELQHQCSVSGGDGFGKASNFGVVEVYSEVMIWKVA